MHLYRHTIQSALAAVFMGGAFVGAGISNAQPADESQGAEVLTRGPVHEAFAGTISYDPEPGMFVDRQPPVLIEEVPPEQRLEGENVTWIPGYWAWDDDVSDFLWISGIWRNLPPGREWVPGYWAEAQGRWQWTSGYWEDAETTEVSYLPEPPKTLERGPNVEAASNEQTWIPGTWVYREDRYAWRPGSWVVARENWVWVPAYYRWTRRGYVYVDGYWDYPVVRRGVVFAPVRFQPAYVARADFSYSPLTVVSLAVFTNHLFLRPSHHHYYFGDYYEPRYRDHGYYASYAYNRGRRGYDPFYAHNRWEHRNERDWDRRREEYYEFRRDNRDARPPRTWAALNSRPQGDRDRDRDRYDLADRFDRVANDRRDGRQRFKAVDKNERERYIAQRQEIRKFGRDREQLEVRGKNVPEGQNGAGTEQRKQKVNRSPVLAKRSDRSDKDGGPPARLQARASDPDDNVRPADRRNPDGDKPKDNRKGDNQPRPDGKREPAAENRDKPGQRRESGPGQKSKADPTPQQKEKSKADPKAQPAPGRQTNREPERGKEDKREGKPKQENPAQERKAEPTPERRANPSPERKTQPTPERKADPAPKRQANPDQKPSQKREAAPSPKREANPNQRVNPTPQRKADPEQKQNSTPKRQATPEQQKKKTEASSAPVRKVESQHQTAERSTQRSAAKPQPAKATQRKAESNTKQKDGTADREKKKKDG